MARDEKGFERIGGNDRLTVYRTVQYGEPKVMLHALRTHDERAGTAISLIERWGVVAAVTDGEDSSGRQRLALMPVAELVQRACDTSAAAYDEFARRGWFVALPELEQPDERKGNQ